MLLTGLRIIDLADQKAAFCSKLLADLGATVTKVERPGGDMSRRSGPFAGPHPTPEQSLSFFYNNTGKKSITLNLEHPEGREIFLTLIPEYDIIVESYAPGYLDKLGLGFNCLSLKNPGIILASVTGFGQTGPRRDYKTCDLVASAYGGQMSVTGLQEPLKHYGAQSYLTASLFAATGILLAVRKQRTTGKGAHLDISIQEAVTATLEHVMVQYLHENTTPKRQGSLHWDKLFHIFQCQDGFIELTLFDKWETFVALMDSEGIAGDLAKKEYLDDTYRRNRLDHIIKTIGNWAKTYTVQDLFELGQRMQFPWAPVASPRQVIKSPQLKDRKFFRDIHPSRADIAGTCPGLPFQLNRAGKQSEAKAPLAGENNLDTYVAKLGFSREQLKQLASRGII